MFKIWFESKVKYIKVTESGKEASVSEVFLFDAVNYTEAESRTIKEMQSIVKGGEFSIQNIKKSKLAEVFPYDAGEYWFKIAVNLVTIDEEAGKEKKITSYYLIMADDIKESLNRLEESLNYLVIPYVVTSASVSNIIEVFPYQSNESEK